jgi:hypothetical protein
MRMSKLLGAALALSVAMAFAAADTAEAAKKRKLTYEQAYEKCKGQINKEVTGGAQTSPSQRYSAGAGCMRKYGYRI